MSQSERMAVVSDTHGLLRPQVRAALESAAVIVHAGDVGSAEVLAALRALAPLKVVRGNVDRGEWAACLPHYDAFEWCQRYFYLRHVREELDLDPSGFDLLIVGHTHRPALTSYCGTRSLNPGSIGPRRFRLPISMAWVTVADNARPDAPLTIDFQQFEP